MSIRDVLKIIRPNQTERRYLKWLKKLAAFLEVSLDELLSTDEMKKVAERNQMALATLQWIRSHSNPINLGGDSALRVSVYKVIWAIL